MPDDLVIVEYQDLLQDPTKVAEKISPLLEKAYGRNNSRAFGILAIHGIPGFLESKERFLPMAHTLAHLSPLYLEENLTDEKSLFNAGWSHGKEKLGGKPDTSKGSYYFNPLVDCPGSETDRAQYPASYPCNLWPSETVIPDFQDAAKIIGTLMYRTVVLLTKHIDHFVQNTTTTTATTSGSYLPIMLQNILSDTQKVKGRLLYYFPLKNSDNNNNEGNLEEDSWIGWHNDSGFLTALAGEIYVNDVTGEILKDCPDPEAGLYVSNRMGETCKVNIPHDCMAVQLGECIQILTGGVLAATPHCVRGITPAISSNVARISLPCFIDSIPTFKLTSPCSRQFVLNSGVNNSKVPHLSERWTENGMTFGEFLQKSFEIYYSWSLSSEVEGKSDS